ncbi:four helix bundle protein [Emticicia sp. CRIBPO]|uniref:four helix bundle protein n=1 Tax=Emticicia sp. CRIBPO TaxID=2683258 RepID=UPI001412A9ED|nr:four helix bundle protein [Emticicia sp. CRIBPO]NBA85775.1 four helix bundle protein [Emticicia sp. CRIBPO]
MNKIEKFEDLYVWQSGLSLSIEIYKSFANCKDPNLKNQVLRAAVSIPSNIAEGFERGYDDEFIRFLKIAKGSTAELRTQIYIASAVNFLDSETSEYLINKTCHISSMLQKLIRTREEHFK